MEQTIIYGNHKLTIRPWAGGKVLLLSADERVKDEMIRMRAEETDAVELLTDPDIRLAAADLEGVMAVVADPERLCLVFSLATRCIKFAYSVEGGADE